MKMEMQKITAYIPKEMLDDARGVTGMGITETLRYGLGKVLMEKNYRELGKMHGKYRSSVNLKELREDR